MPSFDLPTGARLREIDDEDAEELYALVERNRGRLMRWMPWAWTSTIDETRAFIGAAQGQVRGNDGFQLVYVVEGRIAGTIGLHHVAWNDRATSIGYWLGAEYEGAGHATAGVRAVTQYAFGVMGLHRVELRASRENDRSRAVARRAGFQEEGVLRDAERIGDRFNDLVVHAALATEWR